MLEQFFRNNPELHIYSLGDLDDFFWPYTTWYALTVDEKVESIALLYTGQPLPTLLALSEQPSVMSTLLISINHLLPEKFYAHFSPGLEGTFQRTHLIEVHGEHYKMALKDRSVVKRIDVSSVIRLFVSDLDDIRHLYQDSYPDNWFDQRMLDSKQYFGIRKEDTLVSIAGIHVYSEEYGVAALGNITTHSDWRNKGYGTLVTARLCSSLSEKVEHIGLNVKTDNLPALACYKKLGFEIIASYGEFMLQRK
ncbi:GNAT family N-acetyltransferase [candidate division CSSED10-310 bacterium]|uniref:GNAT family N-acetyltransferase n=1 Tax=candidate division CSSED10-310 bacterium TaxID=2855610 RepID=A0ABV6YWE1_UNCC1